MLAAAPPLLCVARGTAKKRFARADIVASNEGDEHHDIADYRDREGGEKYCQSTARRGRAIIDDDGKAPAPCDGTKLGRLLMMYTSCLVGGGGGCPDWKHQPGSP